MNEDLINQFENLRLYYIKNKDKWRAQAYNKAIYALKQIPFKITKISDVNHIKNIGEKIKQKIQEFLETGKIEGVEKVKKELAKDIQKDTVINNLEKIWGVGPVKAKNLYEKHGIESIASLRKRQDLLTTQQKIGLKYYEDLQKKIPRKLITAIYVIIICYLNNTFGENTYKIDIAGSYRRKAEQSSDIDCLLSSDFFNLNETVNVLVEKGLITEVLSMKNEKMMGIARCGDIFFRLDIEFIPKEKYSFALLYFTGSQRHNIEMRLKAKKQGLLLNEHGLFNNEGENILYYPKSEKEIFDALGLQYVSPEHR